jgi:hypothetical protein
MPAGRFYAWKHRHLQVREKDWRGWLGVLTHWHPTRDSQHTVRQLPGVMHRSRFRGISWTTTPCLHSVNMKRLIQMTKGALRAPFLCRP